MEKHCSRPPPALKQWNKVKQQGGIINSMWWIGSVYLFFSGTLITSPDCNLKFTCSVLLLHRTEDFSDSRLMAHSRSSLYLETLNLNIYRTRLQ